MRIPFILGLACLGISNLTAVTVAEQRTLNDLDLRTLTQDPETHRGLRVRFRATFAQLGQVYDRFHNAFTADRYLNLAVWDDQEAIWDPQVRARPMLQLYLDKTRADAKTVKALPKYTQVEITGEIRTVLAGEVVIECHTVNALPELGRFTDNAIYHIQQAMSLIADPDLAEQRRRELAGEDLDAALAESLPNHGRVALLEQKAVNLLALGRRMPAAEQLATALTLMGTDPSIRRDLLPRLHYLRAKALSDEAERRIQDGKDAQALFEQAVTHGTQAITLDPKVSDAYAVLGIALAGLQRFDEAKHHCARAIRMQPDNAEIRWYLGRILDLQGSFDEAIDTLRKAIDLSPKDYRMHKAIARSYFNRGKQGGPQSSDDIVKSLLEYDIGIRLNAKDPDLCFLSGVVLEHAAQEKIEIKVGASLVPATFEMAVKRFQDCLALDEKYVEAHLRLARRFRADNRHDEAVAHFQRVLALDPERDAVYEEFGLYLWKLDRRQPAYEVFIAFHKRKPTSLDALYNLGHLDLELGRWAPSAAWHEKLIALSPQHPRGCTDLVQSTCELKRYQDALRFAQTALKILDAKDPERVRVLRFATLAHWGLGQVAEARTTLDGMLDGATDARLPIVAGWLRSLEKPPAAEAVGQLAATALSLAKAPELRSEALELQGHARYLTGDYPAAEEILRSAGLSDPNQAGWRIGMCLFKRGPACYVSAKPLLEKGRSFRSQQPHHAQASSECETALRTIADWERTEDGKRRAAEQAKAEQARKAQADAEAARRKQAEAEKVERKARPGNP